MLRIGGGWQLFQNSNTRKWQIIFVHSIVVLLKSPRLFQITSKTKHKGLSKFFQTTSKTYARCPRDSLKLHTSKTKHKISPRFFQIMYFKNKIRPPRDSFKHFKNQIQRPLKIVLNYCKNKTQEILKILSNYFKKKTRDPRDCFKLERQKQNTRVPRDSFKLLQKPDTRDP